MSTNRIASRLISAPTPATAFPNENRMVGFVACPVMLFAGQSPVLLASMQHLYQLAFERAQACLRPSRWQALYEPGNN